MVTVLRQYPVIPFQGKFLKPEKNGKHPSRALHEVIDITYSSKHELRETTGCKKMRADSIRLKEKSGTGRSPATLFEHRREKGCRASERFQRAIFPAHSNWISWRHSETTSTVISGSTSLYILMGTLKVPMVLMGSLSNIMFLETDIFFSLSASRMSRTFTDP